MFFVRIDFHEFVLAKIVTGINFCEIAQNSRSLRKLRYWKRILSFLISVTSSHIDCISNISWWVTPERVLKFDDATRNCLINLKESTLLDIPAVQIWWSQLLLKWWCQAWYWRCRLFNWMYHKFCNDFAVHKIITKSLRTFLPAKEKTWKSIFNTNSELSQNRTEKQIVPFKTTVNWLFNDVWRCLIISCFDWKIGVFQQAVARV